MKSNKALRSGFLLAALGMIYGDIGCSPLYVVKYIVKESGGAPAVSEALVLGSLSLILWSLLLLATVKGVLLLLRADNRGEGGHFALYALVRQRGRCGADGGLCPDAGAVSDRGGGGERLPG